MRGGWFAAEGADAAVAAACRKTRQFALEMVITPADAKAAAAATILACGPAGDGANFRLLQDGDRLVLELRAAAGRPEPVTLATLVAGRPQHVLIAYQPGRLAAWRDGEALAPAPQPAGDLGPWTDGPPVFGAEAGGGRPWAGRLEGIAIYNRYIEQEEAKARFAAAAARLKGRRPADRAVVAARLAAATPVPDPKAIAPYVRALAAHEYEVQEVAEGRLDARRILVARWAILDGRTLPAAGKAGEPLRLVLERFEDHPELDSERLIMENVKMDLPLYFDTER